MIIFKNNPVCFWDVDQTLIFSDSELLALPNLTVGRRPIKFGEETFWVHTTHIRKIKEFHARGHLNVVWSAGRVGWAEEVVRKLELEPYVYAVMAKPDWLCDDKPVDMWLNESNRFYVPL